MHWCWQSGHASLESLPSSGAINIQSSWKDATAGTEAHNTAQCNAGGREQHTCQARAKTAYRDFKLSGCCFEIMLLQVCVLSSTPEKHIEGLESPDQLLGASDWLVSSKTILQSRGSTVVSLTGFQAVLNSLQRVEKKERKKDKRAISSLFIRSEAAPRGSPFSDPRHCAVLILINFKAARLRWLEAAAPRNPPDESHLTTLCNF